MIAQDVGDHGSFTMAWRSLRLSKIIHTHHTDKRGHAEIDEISRFMEKTEMRKLLATVITSGLLLAGTQAYADDMMKNDSMGKPAMAKDEMKKDTMTHDGMKKSSMAHDSMKKDGMKKDAMGKDTMDK